MKELNIKFVKFLANKKGAVAIEFVLILMVLVIMFAFMFDLVLLRSTTGKLERTSYSLLNIVKERKQFYKSSYNIDQNILNDMQKIASKLLYNDIKSPNVDVMIEYFELETPAANDSRARKRKVHHYQSTSAHCTPQKLLSTLAPSAPISEELRYVPLYQVTVCTKINSLFRAITSHSNEEMGLIRVSSHGPAR